MDSDRPHSTTIVSGGNEIPKFKLPPWPVATASGSDGDALVVNPLYSLWLILPREPPKQPIGPTLNYRNRERWRTGPKLKVSETANANAW